MPASLTDYEVLYTIGTGSYGTCKKVRRQSDGKIFVWKEMDYGCMTETEKQMLVSEVNLLRELKHENIVRYHERIVDKKRQVLYLIMEFCEGGDLGGLIKRYQRDGRHFEEEMIWKVLAQCAGALNECHKRKDGKSILHRDLKPANIFLDSDRNVKLGDFGLARVLHETSFAKTFVGTPYYMSPEQMNKSSYNEKSDIWSLGCVLYELCTLRPPFLASNQRELALKIRSGHFSKIPSRYSKELSKLIDQMLNVECMHRPSIDELLISPSVSKFTQNKADKCDGDASLKKAVDLTQREAACDKKEAHLRIKEAELAEREIKLQNQEKEIQQRLEMLQEREDYLKKISISKQDMKNLMDDKPELTDKPLTPILCRDRKGVESPSKHVSFKVQDKENDITSIQTAFASRNAGSNLYGLREYDKNSYDFQKRMELRDRLEKAKQRANQLRIAEIETRVKSSNFLNIR